MRLIARDIRHAYASLPALDGISLEVGEGEVLAILGPSGCGKSTLLGVLGGLIAPSAGAVSLTGEPPPGCLNALTYVFQDFSLLPWETVEENIALALLPHRLDRAEAGARVDTVLARTGLAPFRRAYPKSLSGGMRQRVGIARALVVKPAILLMDEPLSALDAQTREIMMEEFEGLFAREAVSAVYVTHNIDEAVRLGDRVLVLSRRPGRIKLLEAITIPRGDRGTAQSAARLDEARHALWRSIAGEARAAMEEAQ